MFDKQLMDEEKITHFPHHGEPKVWSGNQDTVGAILLGIVALVLLFALLRSQKKIRELSVQLKQSDHV